MTTYCTKCKRKLNPVFSCPDCEREYKNEFELRGQLLDWIQDIITGKEVSDFALSFQLVLAV